MSTNNHQSAANPKVRVLSVVGSLRLGGAETYVANVTPALMKHGVHVEICALERVGANLAALEQSGITVHSTPYEGRAPDRLDIPALMRTVKAIGRLVRSGRFDIVHTYLYWADVLGVAGARLAGCGRIIISRQALHGWVHEPRAIFHGLEQVTNLFATELIACSRTALRDAEAHERVLPRLRTVIYNAVNVDAYAPVRPRLVGPLRLVTVGALAHRKGQEYAIDALERVTRSGIEATLVLVGEGPDEAMLRRKVAKSGLNEVVIFAGPQTDPRPYLDRADVFLLPSRQEGFSVALLEAMASSMPAIATDVGGNAEALVDGEGGYIVPALQPEALAAAIAALAGDRSKLPEMGRRNRERVVELFSIESSARRLADWYLNGPTLQHARAAPEQPVSA